MCKFYSAIVLRNGDLLHNENLTSHEDIIRLFNINDSQVNCDKFVRVEFTPDKNSDFPIIEKYKLRVDESSVPDWFESYKEYITQRLKEFVGKRIILSDQKILTGGLYVVKDCIIDTIIAAQVVYMQASTVNEMRGNSTVNEMRGNSTVNEMRDNSTVTEMRGNSTVNVMRGNSTVNEMWENSTVNEMRGNSTVNEMRDNSIVKKNNSKNTLPNKLSPFF
jgi:hypothetical protein